MEETRDADHVVIMDKGRIIAEGTPAELKREHAKTKLVWYTERNAENDEMLENDSRSKGAFEYDQNHYNIYFDKEIAWFVCAHKEVLVDFEVIKGTMDDVFLKLTGKEMSGDNE